MLIVDDVCISYGQKEIIHHISDKIDREDGLTVIVGLNGCGKSTLLRTLGGIYEGYTGEIHYGNRILREIPLRERAKMISYLPQYRRVPNISVERYVLHGRFPHLSYPRHYGKKDFELVDKVLERFQIASLKTKQMSQISGGERQKVYLAMAIVQDACYLLLDEPSTFLDLHCQYEFLRILKELVEEGKTVLMVSHNVQMALQYADNIIVMEKGRIKIRGTPEQVVHSGEIENVFQVKIQKITRDDDKTSSYIVLGVD
ncbi:ABC-type Fe3+-siderophore transport system, ATPase component [Lachnospiraceae bacterium KM106-2]|nr:ABC-type Fe3+-siderophore transport system, ATPase component [Lachnospiraceae bacterium KM106-2]